MRKFHFVLLLVILCTFLTVSCSDKEEGTASEITLESFESNVTDRIPIQSELSESKEESQATYFADEFRYIIHHDKKQRIISLISEFENTDNEFLKNINFTDVIKVDQNRTESKQCSINAVKYTAMALTHLCGLQDEDAIDTVLDALKEDITESDWDISASYSENGVSFTVEFIGEEF